MRVQDPSGRGDSKPQSPQVGVWGSFRVFGTQTPKFQTLRLQTSSFRLSGYRSHNLHSFEGWLYRRLYRELL